MLDEIDLPLAGYHVMPDWVFGDGWDTEIEFHRTLGTPYVVVALFNSKGFATAAEWMESADKLNAFAARLRAHGMTAGYHNHDMEFRVTEGHVPFELIFDRLDDDVVMQFDFGNTIRGPHQSEVPLHYLERYPARAKTVHLKEFSRTNRHALVGEGEVPWTQAFDLCETIGGTEWYIVEHDRWEGSSLAAAERSLMNLREMGK